MLITVSIIPNGILSTICSAGESVIYAPGAICTPAPRFLPEFAGVGKKRPRSLWGCWRDHGATAAHCFRQEGAGVEAVLVMPGRAPEIDGLRQLVSAGRMIR